MNGLVEHARSLLRKAANDLIAGDAILATGQALDAVCFHAQQAAEKSVKAILSLDEVDYPWRHDLGELLALLGDSYSGLSALRQAIIALSPFAVAARYDEAIEPPADEARRHLATARRVYDLAQAVVERRARAQE
jgi:HEPN domain-containing protein